MAKDKGSSRTTEMQTLDPWVKGLLSENYNTAKNLADQPFTPYTAQRQADLAGDQTASADIARSSIGAGSGTLQSAISQAGQAADYNPQQVTAGSVGGMDLSRYMDPYTGQVIDAALADLNRSRQIGLVGNETEATKMGALGGSGEAVLKAETNRGFADAAARTAAQLRSQAYGDATKLASQDLDRSFNASTANQRAGLDAAGLGLQGAEALGNFSNQEATQPFQQAAALNQYGTQAQQVDQGKLDAAYEDFMRQQNYPMQQMALRNGALGMIPTLTNTTSKTSEKGSPWETVGNIATMAAMAFSDERLKKDVEPVGTDEGGRKWYDYRYIWDDADTPKTRGVMAQEIARTHPDAVKRHPSGFLAVDYSKAVPGLFQRLAA